jgi:hypothetical protein
MEVLRSSGKVIQGIEVTAFWDEEARVWVAQSEQVPGLITESGTISALVEKLKTLIPELLDANGYSDGNEVSFNVNAKLTATTYRYHC